MTLVPSPSQTSGPLFGFALIFAGSENAVSPDAPGAVRIEGQIIDGAGPIDHEALVEFWHGEQWARHRVDEQGRYHVVVAKPPAAPTPDGSVQAPHMNVTVFARGLLKQAQTRMYFPDEPDANAVDPILELVPQADRHTLIARADGDALRFDIHLQGEQETAFFQF